MIQVLIYEKSPLFRKGLCELLRQKRTGIRIVLDTADANQTMAYIDKNPLDLCLVILDLHRYSWDHYKSFVEKLSQSVKVLIVSNSMREDLMVYAAYSGAKGYLAYDLGAAEVVHAIREVVGGVKWFQVKGVDRQQKRNNGHFSIPVYQSHGLTLQEIKVLELIRRRFRNKEIATRLNISEQTVKCHVSKIFKKLGVRKRLQLMDHR